MIIGCIAFGESLKLQQSLSKLSFVFVRTIIKEV